MIRAYPFISFIYYLLILVILVMSYNPVMTGISLLMAVFTLIQKKLYSNLKMLLYIAIPATVFLLGIQPLFSHNGVTPLFYINNQAVTLETYVFGLETIFLLLAATAWCFVLNSVITEDKMLYLFGKLSPKLALLISMSIRIIPQLQKRYREISNSRVMLGVGEKKGILRARESATRLSTLTAWSLESSMETSQYMEARGYGIKGVRRTNYHNFRFKKSDIYKLVVVLVAGALCVTLVAMGNANVAYFPYIAMNKVMSPDIWAVTTYALYAGLCAFGLIIDYLEWR